VGDAAALEAAAAAVAPEYEAHFRIAPRVWHTHAAAGARLEPGE
jgi:hypothetical protein